jgi:hypothetical protein
VDDKRILQLVKAASELEEFGAAVSGRDSTLRDRPPRRLRLVHWAAIGLPVAAAVALMVLTPPSLQISEFQVVTVAQRGADSDARHRCILAVSRPANMHLVLVDERLEPWIIPIADDGKGYTRRVEERWEFYPPSQLHEDDARGPAGAVYAIAIAAAGASPTVDDLLAAIPDPIAPAESDDAAVRAALQRLVDDLTAHFDCAVRFEPLP